MSNERKLRYLYIDGQAVPVSEQVYRVYQHYERKEEYLKCYTNVVTVVANKI